MAVLGVASITPAFPRISQELNISANSVSMLIIFFTFPAIILTPVLGVIADRYRVVLRIGQTLGPMLMAIIYVTWGLDCTFYGGGIISIATFLILAVLI